MTERRTEILDTALTVLAEQGMRGLTHRAVDAAAGLPPGSSSYYFRTRAALVTGCVGRLVEVDAEVGGAAVAQVHDAAGFLDLLTRTGTTMLGRERTRTLARYELSLAAARDGELRAALAAGHAAVVRGTAALLARLGARSPEEAAQEVVTVFDGVLFAALVSGDAAPETALRSAVGKVLAAQPGIAGQRSS